MTDYLAHFLERPDQLPLIVGAAVLWLGLTSLGAILAGPGREPAGDALYGWAGLATLFTVAGVFTPAPFTVLAALAGILAAAAAALRWRREKSLLAAGSLRMAILATPLILIASAMVASQWDEFSHWLPSIRFLVEADRFPDAAQPHTGASFPAYPYGWPLLPYLVARLTGGLQEGAGPLLNVLLLLSLGLLVTRIIRLGLPAADAAARPSWGLCALGALAAIPFNPTFAQKVALTSYADTASAVAVGFAVALGWMALDAAAGGDAPRTRRRAWEAGLALTVLVTLKQATFVLFVLTVGAIVIAAVRDPAVGWRRLGALVPRLIVLPLIVYAVWRYHVTTELQTAAEFVLRPPAEWAFALIPDILLAMLGVLAKKGLYLGLMVLAAGFALRALWRLRTSFDRLTLIVGLLFAGYNAFLFFTYVAAFGADDALRAASLWRYNMHLGGACVIFAWYGLAMLWARLQVTRRLARAATYAPALAVLLVVAAPFIFAGKLRFDREPDKPYYRAVARDLAERIPDGRTFAILDPRGSGESWVITLFQLGDQVKPAGYMGAFHDTREAYIRDFITSLSPDAILVHSVTPAVNAVIGPLLEGGAALEDGRQSYLLLRDQGPGWRVAHIWTRPPA